MLYKHDKPDVHLWLSVYPGILNFMSSTIWWKKYLQMYMMYEIIIIPLSYIHDIYTSIMSIRSMYGSERTCISVHGITDIAYKCIPGVFGHVRYVKCELLWKFLQEHPCWFSLIITPEQWFIHCDHGETLPFWAPHLAHTKMQEQIFWRLSQQT